MAGDGGLPLWERALALQERQLRRWEALARGHRCLREALWRSWRIEGWTVKAQCNQARAASNQAKVDRGSLEKRPCFLCAENRPPEQEALAWGGDWWILANPAPLFPHHFTLALRRHGREHLSRHIPAFLDLARELSPELSLFYNGPRSGASAPDHFHFQAYTRGALPVEEEILGPSQVPETGGSPVRLPGGTDLTVLEAAGRGLLKAAGPDREALVVLLRRALALLGGDRDGADGWAEPDLNLLGFFQDGAWKVALFPRRAHRPACYFREGPGRLMVSPGGADLGGMLVLVRKTDLERLDPPTILGIYREVALSGEEVLSLLGPEKLLEG